MWVVSRIFKTGSFTCLQLRRIAGLVWFAGRETTTLLYVVFEGRLHPVPAARASRCYEVLDEGSSLLCLQSDGSSLVMAGPGQNRVPVPSRCFLQEAVSEVQGVALVLSHHSRERPRAELSGVVAGTGREGGDPAGKEREEVG